MFSNITQLKEYVGGAANVSVSLDILGPSIHAASQAVKYWLSPEVYDALATAVTDDNLSTEQEALLPYVRRPLSLLTMYEYVKVGGVQITGSGIQREESEHMKSAFKYQENQYKEQMRRLGYDAIEEMIAFLHDNIDDYNTYAYSTAYTRSTSYLVNDAATWRDRYSAEADRYTFEMLLPIIDDVESLGIADCISDDELKTLVDALHDGDADDKQKLVIHRLQRAVCQFAFTLAVHRRIVRLDGRNIVQSEIKEGQGYETKMPPTNARLGFPIDRADMMGNQHLQSAINYMRANLDDFPDYKVKHEAELAAAKKEAEEEAQTIYQKYPGLDTRDDDPSGILPL